MTNEQVGRVLELFERCCDDASRREEILARCSPAEADMVRRMLIADRRSGELVSDEVQLAVVEDVATSLGPAVAETAPEVPGYELLEELGRGGSGVVYRAQQLQPRRFVALKVVRDAAAADADVFAEAQALAGLAHPTIPVVYQVGRLQDGSVFIVMELVHGQPFTVWASGRPRADILRALAAVCDGVQHAHERSVVHRDLKPDNVLVGMDGVPRLVDFGLATRDGREAQLGGTLPYMAPEVLRGAPATPLSDVFSLGVMLAEAIGGTRPTPLTHRTVSAQLAARSRPLPLAPSVDEPLRSVCRVAIADAPERYPTARQLALDVRRILAGHPPKRLEGHVLLRLQWWAGRHRRTLQLVAALLLMGALGWGVQQASIARKEGAAALRVERLEAQRALGTADEEDLDRLLALPTVRHTVAWADAMLRRAHRRDEAGDLAGARSDRAMVLSSMDGPRREQAAQQLASSFVRERRWASLQALLPHVRDADEHARFARLLAFAYRRFDDPVVATHPLAKALRTGRPLDARPVRVRPMELDGRSAFASLQGDEGDVRVFAAEPGTPLLRRVAYGDDFEHRPYLPDVVGGRWLVAPSLQRPRHLLAVDLHDRDRPPSEFDVLGRPWSVAFGTSTPAEGPRLHVGTAPSPRGARWIDDRGRAHVLLQSIDDTNSDVEQLMFTDLDGDGIDELVVALGPWLAHDVQVYRITDTGPVPAGRRQFGGSVRFTVAELAPGRRVLVVVKTDQYHNPEVFGADQPLGDAAGVYILKWTGQDLIELGHHPSRDVHAVRPHVAADIDGDGRDELFVGAGGMRALLLSLGADGTVDEAFSLGSTTVMAAMDVDDDGVEEVLLRDDTDDHRLWVVGDGEMALPPVPMMDSIPNAGGDALTSLGLYAEAAERRRFLASVSEGTERTQHLLAAVDAWRMADRPERALSALEEAEQGGAAVPEALRRVLERRMHRFAGHGEVDASWRVSPRRVALDGHSLPLLGWRDVVGVRHVPGRGLHMQLVGEQVVFDLPVEVVSDRVGLMFDLHVDSLDFAGSLDMVLEDTHGTHLALRVEARGGGGATQLFGRCLFERVGHPRIETAWDVEPSSFDARLGVDQAGDDVLCTGDLVGDASMTHRRSEAIPQGAARLSLRFHTLSEEASSIDAVLRHLELRGIELGASEVEGRAHAWLAGDLERLVEPTAPRIDRIEAHVERGELDTAAALLRVSDIDEHRARLVSGMRRDPSAWLVVTADLDARVRAALYTEAWLNRYGSLQREDLEVMAQHPGVDAMPVDDGAVAELLLRRAEVLGRLGQHRRAERILRRLLDHSAFRIDRRAAVELVASLQTRGAVSEARRVCMEVVRSHPDDLYLQDQIRHRAALGMACAASGGPRDSVPDAAGSGPPPDDATDGSGG